MSKLDEFLKHSINKELYGNNVREESVQLLTELYQEIITRINSVSYISSKKMYESLLQEIEERLQQYNVDYKKILKSHIKTVTNTESEWLNDFLTGIGLSIVIPTTLFNSVKFSPVTTQVNYEGVADTISENLKKTVTTSLKNAYLIKEPTSEVTARLENKLTKFEQNVDVETATVNTSAFNMTDYLIYKQNKIKVRYSAMLDNYTCAVCGSYDGMEFESGSAPLLPVHENCRCTLIPLEIAEEETPTYSEWFETLDESDKKEILGKGRYELYQQGFGLDRFVNNGEKLTLEQLREQNLTTNE